MSKRQLISEQEKKRILKEYEVENDLRTAEAI